MTNLLAAIGIIAISVPLILILGVLAVAWKSWWLYPAWSWFLVPLGLPEIRFWHFAALLFLLDTVTKTIETKKDDRKTEWASVAIVALWLIMAWVIMRWMHQR